MNKNFKRFLTLALALVMVFGMFPMNVFAEESETSAANVAKVGETEYATLAEAITAANAIEGGATVTLLSDVTLGQTLTIKGDVTIEGAYTITWGDTTKTMFSVNKGKTLTLDGGLVIDGGNEWVLDTELYNQYLNDNSGLFNAIQADPTGIDMYPVTSENGKSDFGATANLINNSGTVNINTATIQNVFGVKVSEKYCSNYHHVYYAATSGIRLINGGNVNLTGATIKHNASGGDGLVVYTSGGVININNGTVIEDNYAGSNGGMLKIYYSGTVNMNDGAIIRNNKASDSNGVVVQLYSNSTMNMNGGKIANNSGLYGCNNGRNAPIYVHSSSHFIMTNGEISNNSGTSYGGVDAPYTSTTSSTVSVSGGRLVYNESRNGNSHFDINGYDYMTITGGWYTQDPTKWVADGYIVVVHEGMGENSVTLYEVTTAVAYNVDDDKYFADLSDALDVADAGETVQLLKTWYEELVLVPVGVTFDLNGNVVKADNVLSFGVVMDNQEDLTKIGGIEIDIDTTKAFTKLQPVNGGYLPIYDTEVGMYKFFTYKVESNKIDDITTESVKFYTRVVFENAEAYKVLMDTTNDGIDFVLNMNWTGMDGFDLRFVMSDGNVKDYAALAYAQVSAGEENTKAMTVTIHGIDALDSGAFISAAPCVETIAEVTASAAELVHTIS